MNGWKRLGIIASVLWAISVCSYAGYEFWQFAIPFNSSKDVSWNNESSKPSADDRLLEGFRNRSEIADLNKGADDNFFVTAHSSSWSNEYGYGETFTSTLNTLFYIFIAGTTAFGWVLVYSILAVVKWVKEGFKRQDSNTIKHL
jgi:hypothetical protein